MSKDSPFPPSPNRIVPVARASDEPVLAGPDLLLDNNLFWDKYKLPVVALLTLVIVAVVAAEIYQNSRHRAAVEASAQLLAARTPAEFQKVIDDHPGTAASANASLLLGRAKLDAKDYAGAAEVWKGFVDKYPQSVLAPSALVGMAGALEFQGKYDEARAAYQKAATSYPKSYVAPLARIDEGTLLKSQRKIEEARRVYENIVATYPQSDVLVQAQAELATLKALPPLSGNVPAVLTTTPAASVLPTVSPEAVNPPPPTSPGVGVSPVTAPPAATAPVPSATPMPSTATDAATALGAPTPVVPAVASPAASPAPTP